MSFFRETGNNKPKHFISQKLVALPMLKSRRVWVPLRKGRMVSNSLALYTPFSWKGRMVKKVFELALSLPWAGRIFGLKKFDFPDNFENLIPTIQEALGKNDIFFSLAQGTPGKFQKLSIQFMSGNGDILAYLKFPVTQESVSRIRQEKYILEKISTHLNDAVPKIFLFKEIGGVPGLLLSPGHGKLGPLSFEGIHAQFLSRLQRIKSVETLGEYIVAQVEKGIHRLNHIKSPVWREGLKWSERRLRGKKIRLVPFHGDFAPWNIKVSEKGIFVFDWECGAEDMPVSWDALHFTVQVSSLLGKNWEPEKTRSFFPELDKETWEGLLALYLVYSGVDCIYENSPNKARALLFRKKVLKELLK